MFATGLPQISLAFFSAASEAVAIPTAVQIFVFLATMLAGRVTASTPMLFGIGGIAIFVIGGLTGVMVALAPFDWQAHDSYFVVAHLHYVLIGGMLFPIVAGIYYWWPLVGGRMLSDQLGRIAFWTMFAGFNLGFFPMHLTGLLGMPRRVFTYPEAAGWGWLNLASTVGAAIFAAGVLVVVIDVLRPKRGQSRAPLNPWAAGTLEWITPPGENWGVRSVPRISSRYPVWDEPEVVRDVAEGSWYLADAEEGRREALITSVLDADPEQVLRVGGPSWLPMLSALTLGVVFLALTFHWWLVAVVFSVLFLVPTIAWIWTGTAEIPEKPEKDVGRGLKLPLYVSGERAVGWWGMFITMVGDATAFASLVFGYFFYWTIRPGLDAGHDGPGTIWPMVSAGLFLLAWGTMLAARRLNGNGATGGMRLALCVAIALTVAAGLAGFAGPWFSGLDPTAHVYPAIVWVIVIWTLAHAAVGIVMQIYCLARSVAGRLTPVHDADLRNSVLYCHFLAATAVIAFVVVGLFPLAV